MARALNKDANDSVSESKKNELSKVLTAKVNKLDPEIFSKLEKAIYEKDYEATYTTIQRAVKDLKAAVKSTKGTSVKESTVDGTATALCVFYVNVAVLVEAAAVVAPVTVFAIALPSDNASQLTKEQAVKSLVDSLTSR
ncbi:hypothetical protein [Heyndrickxia coagulans]|uniref:hypothetical protein n=1 Tax=Heyndrickxia coagulans TaxID=1398 RepID=UPI002E1B4A35|nr:hypothetical protein [Heyndrickxia coagulans]